VAFAGGVGANEEATSAQGSVGRLWFQYAVFEAHDFFSTLVLLDELADRGVELVPHFEKDMFYQCLLRLRGSALNVFLRCGQPGKAWCKKAIKDADQACLAFNAPPLEPDSASVACELLEDAEPRQQPLLPALVDREEYKRVIVTGDVGSVKVYFDHYSGCNGQRVYANCKGGVCHDNCFQWRQCTDVGSRDEIARRFFCVGDFTFHVCR
jgi:hypothetical protein